MPIKDAPFRVFVVFAVVFPPLLILAFFAGREAWLEWRRVEGRGTVVDTRVVRDDRPHPRNVNRWCTEWLVAYGDGRQQWFRVRRSATEGEAREPEAVGRAMTIWYDPAGPGEATDTRPTPLGKTAAAVWLTVVGAAGLVAAYALVLHWTGRRKITATR